jgi:hypothetical protein
MLTKYQNLTCEYKSFVAKAKGKNTTSKIRVAYRREGNFNMNHKEVGCKELDRIHLASGRGLLRTLGER